MSFREEGGSYAVKNGEHVGQLEVTIKPATVEGQELEMLRRRVNELETALDYANRTIRELREKIQ